jgi:hypothetical protein
MYSRLAVGPVLLVVLAASLGCGGSDGGGGGKNAPLEKKKTAAVRGIVKYKGNPVKDATVIFMPREDGKGVPARGTTDGVGSFTLSSYDKDDGAPPGQYKVLVTAILSKEVEPGVLAPEPEGGFKSPIPTKYASAATTDILVTVKEGDNDIPIDLK